MRKKPASEYPGIKRGSSLKSVEFLITLTLLLSIYAFFYSYYSSLQRASETKLENAKDELESFGVSSLISAMCHFGYPFEYEGDLPRTVPKADCPTIFDPLSGGYRFQTCGRLK